MTTFDEWWWKQPEQDGYPLAKAAWQAATQAERQRIADMVMHMRVAHPWHIAQEILRSEK